MHTVCSKLGRTIADLFSQILIEWLSHVRLCRAAACASSAICISDRRSVCPSRCCIVMKLMQMSSSSFQHLIFIIVFWTQSAIQNSIETPQSDGRRIVFRPKSPYISETIPHRSWLLWITNRKTLPFTGSIHSWWFRWPWVALKSYTREINKFCVLLVAVWARTTKFGMVTHL